MSEKSQFILTFDPTKVLNCTGTKIKYVYQRKVCEVDIEKLPFPFPFPSVPNIVCCPSCRSVANVGPDGHQFKFKLVYNDGPWTWTPIMICKYCKYWGKHLPLNTKQFMHDLLSVHQGTHCPICNGREECSEMTILRKTIENLYNNYPEVPPSSLSEKTIERMFAGSIDYLEDSEGVF